MSKLVGLQFSFKYRRGVDNGAVDALPRVGHLLALDALSICQPQWLQEVANSYETDADAQDLRNAWPSAAPTSTDTSYARASSASMTSYGLAPTRPSKPSRSTPSTQVLLVATPA